ncbi:MAG: DUF4398 domain-containing protein [Steroidobacteraceae bacterium]
MTTPALPQRTSLLCAIVGLTGTLMLCACASMPSEPTANLQRARHAIAVAEQANASRYAAHDLNAARANLAAADGAVTEGRMTTAQRLADEATADANLATAQSENVMANSVNDEMKRSTATLIEEMRRSSGDPQ